VENHIGGLIRLQISEKEVNRQYRVLKQMLSMHTMLRDRYANLALIIDIILLACAVVFCSTTFVSNEAFRKIGLLPEFVRFILGIASILAFFTSLIALRVGWKGKEALHREASQKLTAVLALFRETRNDDGTWSQDRTVDLKRDYWNAMSNIIEIPEKLFLNLKSRHLRKVMISKMLSAKPGSPVFVLKLTLFFRSIKKTRGKKTVKRKAD